MQVHILIADYLSTRKNPEHVTDTKKKRKLHKKNPARHTCNIACSHLVTFFIALVLFEIFKTDILEAVKKLWKTKDG